jgi:hypothetical protein
LEFFEQNVGLSFCFRIDFACCAQRTSTELSMGLPVRNEDHWLWIGGPVPRGSAAITLGSLVVVRSEAAMSEHFAELLRHERVHVSQWQELGVIRFLGKYLGSYMKFRLRGYGHDAAYRRIPLEIAAVVIARAGRPQVAREVTQELVTN